MQLINQNKPLTNTAKHILATQIGYRNEGISTSDYRNRPIHDLLAFEIQELENNDIIEYLSDQNIINAKQSTDEQLANIETYLTQQFGQPINHLYGLWLTDDQGIEIYQDEDDEDEYISKYNLNDIDNAIIISDLGLDGILIVTTEAYRPNEIEA